ncbi:MULTISPECIES: spermidine synthase [Deferrisoma]
MTQPVDLWFREVHREGYAIGVRVTGYPYSGESRYQKIDVVDTALMGKVLLLDGIFMLTEKDEFIYHDMLVHVPLFTHPNPRSVLIIGGGDGGSAREALRHPTVERVDMVELDEKVVEVCKEYFPTLTCSLDDPRLTIRYEDGIEFVKGKAGQYDVVIVDSTDPIGPAVGLFSKSFYADCHRALRDDGVLTAQIGSVFFDGKEIRNILGNLKASFPWVRPYIASVPTYPGGAWSFGFASKGPNPLDGPDAKRVAAMDGGFRYYNPEIHTACFTLPTYFREAIGG